MPTWPWEKSGDRSAEQEIERLMARLQELKDQLESETSVRKAAEAAVVKAKSGLDMSVRDRTREIAAANETLRAQILERKRAETELRQVNSYLDSIIENIPDMIFLKDAQQLRFVRFNRAGEELLGYSRDELLGKNDHDIFPKEEADFFTQKDRETLNGGKVVEIREEPIETRYKGLRILHTKKIPVLDREGRPLYLLGISEDITDKKHAEEERRFAEVLRQSNLELEQFAYVASHDLQEPLRKVMAFGELLKVECNDQLNENGRNYVDRMQRSIARMQELIEALLAYSRVSRETPQLENISLDEVARGVLSDLELLITKTRATVQIAHLPRVKADRHRMRQLFQNLLSNALKFHKVGEAPQVVIGSCKSSRPDWAAFEVVDRGIGFDAKYSERIFQPFERLHGRDEFEGTGVGLAICQRIVQRHGGQIRCESQVGDGSRFIVELLAASEPKEGA